MNRLIPFSPDVYVSMFGGYNGTYWPALLAAVVLGGVMLYCLKRADRTAGRVLALIVGASWIWTGWAFHIETYADLNWAAVPFGILFIVQGVLSVLWGGLLGRFEIIAGRTRSVEIGVVLLFAALALHPLLTFFMQMPIETTHGFAITPATTALISVAVLFTVYGRASFWLLIWPVLWSAWDLASAWTMMLYRDAALPALTLAAAAYLIVRMRR